MRKHFGWARAGLGLAFVVNVMVAAPAEAQLAVNSASVTPPAGVTDTISGNNSATDSDTVTRLSDLALAVVDTPDPVAVSALLTYTLTVSNAGPSAIRASDTLSLVVSEPAGLTGCSYTPSAGTFNVGTIAPGATGTGTWTAVTVPSGGNVTLTIQCTVSSGTASSASFTATVVPPSGTSDPDCSGAPVTCLGNNTSAATTTVNGAQLTLSKTASSGSFTVGVPASFTLQLSNTGTAATTASATITDTIPVGLTIGTLPAGCSAAGQTVSCTVASGLTASGSASFVIPVTPAAAAPTSITNSASVSGGGDGSCPAAARCTSSVTVPVNRPQLTLVKTASGASFTVGVPASFTLQLNNTGTAATTAAATVTDTIPTGLTIGTLPAGCTSAGQTVSCVVAAGLAAGGSTSFVIPVNPSLAAGSSIVNTATASGGGDSTCPGAARCSSTVLVPVNSPQLTLLKTASGASFTVGVPASFTLQLTNSGTAATTATATITDTIPAGLTIGTLPAGCTAAGQTVSCTVAAGLAASGSTSFVIPVNPSLAASSSITNSASVSGGGDFTCPAAAHCSSSVTVPVNRPQLTLVKNASGASFVVGVPASFTLQLSNTGTAATTAIASITDTIPTGLTIGTLPANCTAAAQTVTCTVAAGLAAGGNTSFVIPVTPSAVAPSSITNTASVSGGGDSTCPATTRCSSAVTVPVNRPQLTLVKTASGASFTVGVPASFTLQLNNTGTAATTAGAIITDVVPASLTIGILPAGCTSAAQTVTCIAPSGVAAPGAVSFVIPVTPTVNAPVTNSATVSGGGDDTCPAAARCTSSVNVNVVAPGVTVSPTSGLTTTEAGATDSYTVVLDAAPSSDVTVTITGDADVSVSPTSLTFTPLNWNLAQTVTVAAVDDTIAEGAHTGAITHGAAGGGYNAVLIAGVTVDITDNDVAGISFAGVDPGTALPESSGAGDTYTVQLTSTPQSGGSATTASIVITPTADCEVSVNGGAFGSSATITTSTLTAANVTVRAFNDLFLEGPQTCAVSYAFSSLDPVYNAIVRPLDQYNVTDNEGGPYGVVAMPGFLTSSSGSESLSTVTLTVYLTINGTGTGPRLIETPFGVGFGVTGGTATGADYALPAGSVTFNSLTTISGSNAFETFTLNIVNDAVDEPDETVILTVDPNETGTSGAYDTAISRSVANLQHTYTIIDDDAAGVLITESGGSTDVTEGGATDTYGVVLTSQPTSDVTITVTGDAQASVSPTTLTFTTANWNVAQVVTVAAVNDAVAEGAHTGTLTHSAAGGGYDAVSIASVTANISDNDTAAVNIVESAGATNVTEAGATDTYTVVLNSQPTANVAITVTGDAQASASPSTLTFTTANWNVAQVVTVAAIDDAVAEGAHTGTLTHSATGGGYNAVSITSVTATITDNDTAGVSLVQSGGTTAVTEGGATDSYTLVLTSQPTANVSIALSGTQVTPSPTPIVFTSGNWNVAQTVTVTAIDDAVVEGSHSGSVSANVSSLDANYSGLPVPNVSVAITDNDSAGVNLVQSGGTTAVTEGGATDSYTLVLTSQPTANVSIALSGTQVTPSPTPIVFTSGNWNVTQTVTVTAIDDAIAEGAHSGAVSAVVSSSDSNYGGLAVAPVSVAITDNDNAGVSLVQSGGTTTVTEGGATDSYTLVLTSQPTANVSIALSGSQVTPSPTPIVFTIGNWNLAQTVTVTAIDDAIAEGAHSGAVSAVVSSSDANYGGLAVAPVSVAITDNDNAGVSLVQSGGTTAVTEGGATDSYTLVLTSQPTANVSIALNGSQVTPSPTPIEFTSGNWNVAQTVTVTAIDDAIAEGAHSGAVSAAVSSSDSNYGGLAVAPVSVAITDNDNAGVSLVQSGGNTAVTEGGATDSYTLVLTSQPTANVSIALSGTQVTPSPTPIVFTSGNWNVAQTVTVTAIDDAIAEGAHSGAVSAVVSSSDSNYGGLAVAPVSVAITDNDNAGYTLVQSGGNTAVTEGGATDSYTLALTSQPTANVSIALSGTQVTPSPTPIVFTPANWNVAQTVTVTAIDDAIAEGAHTGSVTANASSADVSYQGLPVPAVSVAIGDNDVPGVTLVQSAGSTAVAEGGATDSLTLVLQSQPIADVTITLTGTEVTPSPTSLLFTSANWNVAQAVTVTAIDDAIDEASPHPGQLSLAVASSDTNYQGLAIPMVPVDVSDNDTAGIALVQSGGNTAVTEGGATDSYTLVLQSQPTADVAIVLGVGTQAQATPGTLTFTAANWNVAQTVTVNATDDNLVEGAHSATISHGVSSSDLGYSGLTLPAVSVSITDNDSATVQFAPTSVSQSEATSPMTFTVTLSNPVQSGVTLAVNSTPGTATAADFTAISGGTVTFAPNTTTSQTVNVTINNDALDEDDETFSLTLSGLTATGNVTLGAATANATILDDDATPTLAITSPSQNEGNAGSAPMNFSVSLSAASGRTVSFSAATANGSATASGDFIALAATPLTIPAGQTSLTIPVTINGDAIFEGNETFTLNLTGITNATPGTLTGTGTIVDDDQQPTTTTITGDTPDPTVTGQPYLVSVTVAAQTTSPAGTVTISDGSASCGPVTLSAGTAPNSSASCNLTSTSAGAKTLTASYSAASTAFGNSNGTAGHQVNAAGTAISVVGPVRSRINQPTTFTFALSVSAPGAGSPAGTVTLSSGAASCTVTVPTATPSCALSFSALGSRTVSAAFVPGNTSYTASSSSGAGNAQTLVYALSDIAVTKSDAVSVYRSGDLIVYTVTVRNNGPDGAVSIRVRDDVPVGLTNVTWSCDASGGAVCTQPSGTANLDMLVANLPNAALLNYTFFGNVVGAPGQIVNTASVELPADTTIEDPTLANNSASDTDLLDDLFKNGFEDASISAPSGGYRLPSAALRSALDEVAVAVYRLSDANGEALRVYARVFDGQVQYALATRDPSGALRLGHWRSYANEPNLRWSARQQAGGWVLQAAELL